MAIGRTALIVEQAERAFLTPMAEVEGYVLANRVNGGGILVHRGGVNLVHLMIGDCPRSSRADPVRGTRARGQPPGLRRLSSTL